MTEVYLADLNGAIDCILSHPLFADMRTAAPLQIGGAAGGSSGVAAPFIMAEFSTAVMTRGRYQAAQNIFAASFTRTPSKRVPYSAEKVKAVCSGHLAKAS